MKQELIFISDLHLSLEKTEICKRFLNFLKYRATSAKSLYILGDLFDAWIGDDDNTPPIKTIKQALRKLCESGTEIFLMQGNRDFLLGKQFCDETGLQLLDEFAVIEVAGQPVLLTHGDLLCTDDVAYQAFRLKAHSQTWQDWVLSKPLWQRLLAARWYRLRSFFHKRKKTQEIMDVNQQTVLEVMRRYHCQLLIHGHTHRPARHEFYLDTQTANRWVLAEWKKQGSQLLCWNGDWFTEDV